VISVSSFNKWKPLILDFVKVTPDYLDPKCKKTKIIGGEDSVKFKYKFEKKGIFF